ncbi:MAG: peptidylprolyl isomerase A [Desulfuromonas sp.]|mgnify:CR=1 FL=1|nr:MAG: peptidylprolyl isomerase A [Desulfuromonas sp.]
MRRLGYALLLVFVLLCPAFGAERVLMETTLGNVMIELDDAKAPVSVKNFLRYVDAKFYDGTIFHRVIDDFMIQGGGFDQDVKKKGVEAAIINEADNGLKNDKGTIAMARTSVVDSATSQFFINLKNNNFLNHRGKSPQTYGYAVFGRVVEGMDVVEKIGQIKTVRRGGHQNFPQPQVVITRIARVEAK